VQKNFGSTQSLAVLETLQASVDAQLTVPIYQGGSEYAAIRQAKETRDQVQANVTQAWGQLEAAKAQIDAAQSQVTAAATACARMPASASAPRSTCSMPSRLSSTPAWRWSPRNATASWPPIPCWRRPVSALTADPRAQDRGLRVVHYQQVRDALGRHVLILSPTRAQLKGSSRRSASACGVARTLTLHSSH